MSLKNGMKEKTERSMFSKLILIHRFIDIVILLLTGKGNLAREAVDQGICDFLVRAEISTETKKSHIAA